MCIVVVNEAVTSALIVPFFRTRSNYAIMQLEGVIARLQHDRVGQHGADQGAIEHLINMLII